MEQLNQVVLFYFNYAVGKTKIEIKFLSDPETSFHLSFLSVRISIYKKNAIKIKCYFNMICSQ